MLQDLYQEVIVDHGRSPRNKRPLEGYTHSLEGYNPLCGDRLTLFLKIEKDVIEDISFEGAGCAISMASTSLMTEAMKGKKIEEAEALFQDFHQMIMDETFTKLDSLGKLQILSGVREFPMRVKCATLPWHTLKSALRGKDEPVKTE